MDTWDQAWKEGQIKLEGKRENHINHFPKYCSRYNNNNNKNKRIVQKYKNWSVTGENISDAQLNTVFFFFLFYGV